MTDQQKTTLIFLGVIAAFVLAAVFVYPAYFGASKKPWHLGLDLVGGSYLVYEVDMRDVASGDRDSVMNGLRDVMERRVNAFGVSEPQIFSGKEGEAYRLIVELAGIKDINQAIEQIGRTAKLDFREVVESGTSSQEYIPTELNGRYLTSAHAINDPQVPSRYQIEIKFDSTGAKIFEDLTAKNINKPIAILDRK